MAVQQSWANYWRLISYRQTVAEEIEDASLDAIFSEDDSGMIGDDSGSDGYLSEVWIIICYLNTY